MTEKSSAQSVLTELLTELNHSRSAFAFLDVRSEGEWEKGSVPGFVSFPILNNAERHQVGLTYKEKGQHAAIELGLKLVGPHREERARSWIAYLKSKDAKAVHVSCWRGGLRSQYAAEWLREAGFASVRQIEGGYKALRRELLSVMERPLPASWVVAGCTGARKTELLQEASAHFVDLEGIAHHRGSAFGRPEGGEPPPQASFENHLFLELWRIQRSETSVFLLEDESRTIGPQVLPLEIFNRICTSPVIWIEASVEERATHLAQEYAIDPIRRGRTPETVRKTIESGVQRISKKLGGLMTAQVMSGIQDAFESAPLDIEKQARWVQDLLVHYYDRYYEAGSKEKDRPVLFRGNYEECKQWIQEKFKTRSV